MHVVLSKKRKICYVVLVSVVVRTYFKIGRVNLGFPILLDTLRRLNIWCKSVFEKEQHPQLAKMTAPSIHDDMDPGTAGTEIPIN